MDAIGAARNDIEAGFDEMLARAAGEVGIGARALQAEQRYRDWLGKQDKVHFAFDNSGRKRVSAKRWDRLRATADSVKRQRRTISVTAQSEGELVEDLLADCLKADCPPEHPARNGHP